MKKMILSLSMLMIMGTSSSFGKTNGQPSENNNQPRTEVRQDNGRNNQQNVRQDGGRTYKVECGRRGNSQPVPQPQPQPRHNSTVDKVTTGVVIGSVVVGLISSLVK